MRRSLIALLLLAALPPFAAAQAQRSAAPAPARQTPAADCARLPGGNAPIDRIAALQGRLSTRSLVLTYFGKPLWQLDDNDFDQIVTLSEACARGEAEVARARAERFRELVKEATATLRRSRAWLERAKRLVEDAPEDREGLVLVQGIWVEMLNREEEMLPTDVKELSDAIIKKQNQIYATAPVPPPRPAWE
ncbi:MAG: hypothetical protein OHK0024_28100 [Thalassobaculales bacterium]